MPGAGFSVFAKSVKQKIRDLAEIISECGYSQFPQGSGIAPAAA
jgi:hypothetical protein